MTYDLIVRGGTVATALGTERADIGVRHGVIVAVTDDLGGAEATTVVDATGLLVLPGAIDVHTHFANEVGGHETADDYESGTVSAAFGGITTIINYTFQEKGQPIAARLADERERAQQRAAIDFGFHLIVTDPMAGDLDEGMAALVAEGSPSIKIFTAIPDLMLDDTGILRVLEAAAAAGVLVNVHAEDGAMIRYLTDRLLASGATGMSSLGPSRPPLAEASAIQRVALYSRMLGATLYIVHVSSAAALESIEAARATGQQIWAETRPAYLFMDDRRYQGDDDYGKFVACWPPLRSQADQQRLWDGLRSGSIQTYATDHTSWMAVEKTAPGLTFEEVPGGFANVETSIGMLYSEGVVPRRISLETFVSATSTQPAKIFGLWPRKGAIAIGSDADLMLLDPEAEREVRMSAMHSKSDVEPYEGWQAHGWPVITVLRGEVIVDHGKWLGAPGRGRYVERLPLHP